MILMSRGLKLFAVVVLVALLPLRAVAGVTIGICPAGHEDMAPAAHAIGHGHSAPSLEHHGEAPTSNSAPHACNICAEHCSSATFAPAATSVVGVPPAGRDRSHFSDHGAPAFITDQLDRPPLA